MRLSRESRYALEALSVLAARPLGEYVESRTLAAEAKLPAAFLSKIMPSIARSDVLSSARGKGYRLERAPETITLGEILRAVEGTEVIWDSCIFWREECDEGDPCPLHFQWAEVKPVLREAMDAVTLADIRDHGIAAAGTLAG
ncbi:MAG: Rrf2 family transcriptional regulator [Actinomycetota bacterium]